MFGLIPFDRQENQISGRLWLPVCRDSGPKGLIFLGKKKSPNSTLDLDRPLSPLRLLSPVSCSNPKGFNPELRLGHLTTMLSWCCHWSLFSVPCELLCYRTFSFIFLIHTLRLKEELLSCWESLAIVFLPQTSNPMAFLLTKLWKMSLA